MVDLLLLFVGRCSLLDLWDLAAPHVGIGWRAPHFVHGALLGVAGSGHARYGKEPVDRTKRQPSSWIVSPLHNMAPRVASLHTLYSVQWFC